jgi:ABC-type Fe3+-hydroxamate transport system substrate-binding protein
MSRLVTDQLHQNVTVPDFPARIVSLVPSQTELLYALGLSSQVVGITKFCVHPPEWKKQKVRVGGTKQFNFEAIHALQPDLVIGNKEENYEEGIRLLQERYPVWMSDIVSLHDAYAMMEAVGTLTNTESKAQLLVAEIKKGLTAIELFQQQRVLYLIWRKPWMAAGRDTFIHSMLKVAGLENVVETARYPELTEAEIKKLNPEFVFLSSEPFPFNEKHVQELRRLLPSAKMVLVDGEMFSWYGSRLRLVPEYFKTLHIHLKPQTF